MNFEKMSLAELAKFWIKDWESESPELENPNTMRAWDNAVDKQMRSASELELLQFLDMFKEEDYIETLWNVRKHLALRFTETLQEQVREIQTTVEVLLKEHENDSSKITIGQLNRLKGGL